MTLRLKSHRFLDSVQEAEIGKTVFNFIIIFVYWKRPDVIHSSSWTCMFDVAFIVVNKCITVAAFQVLSASIENQDPQSLTEPIKFRVKSPQGTMPPTLSE